MEEVHVKKMAEVVSPGSLKLVTLWDDNKLTVCETFAEDDRGEFDCETEDVDQMPATRFFERIGQLGREGGANATVRTLYDSEQVAQVSELAPL